MHNTTREIAHAEQDISSFGAGCPLTTAQRGHLHDVLLVAHAEGFDCPLFGANEIVDIAGAQRALDTVAQATDAQLHSDDADGALVVRMVRLADRVRALQCELRDFVMREHDSVLGRTREALASLHSVDSMGDAVKRIAAAACDVGFDRSIVSRITNSVIVPQAIHITGDNEWARQLLAAVRTPRPLNGTLLETEFARKRGASVVSNAQTQHGVDREIAELSRSRRYLAAPIRLADTPIGMLHVDRYFHDRPFDHQDCTTMALFSTAVAQVLSRALLQERLDRINSALRTTTSHLRSLTTNTWHSDSTELTAAGTHVHLGEGIDKLTRRENDVLRLLAAGATNATVARHLVISEGTVKSHVGHILRKLDAVNRAEAVTHWYRHQNHSP